MFACYCCIIGSPETDLVGNMEGLSENPNGVELDDVMLNRNIDEILSNDAWANEAVYVNCYLLHLCHTVGVFDLIFTCNEACMWTLILVPATITTTI